MSPIHGGIFSILNPRYNVNTTLLSKNEIFGPHPFMKVAHTTFRPFSDSSRDEWFDPNYKYRNWLEQHVGKQHVDWNWRCSRVDLDILEIDFRDKESAILFELTWQ